MKGLSSLERIVLECIGTEALSYEMIQMHTGLLDNVCFNVLQALVLRGLLKTDGSHYTVSDMITPLVMEEINGMDAKVAESMELMEALLEQRSERVFRFQKVALSQRDEKIFLAMLSNLDAFLSDAHEKAQKHVPLKDRKVIFWGVGEVKKLMTQIAKGA